MYVLRFGEPSILIIKHLEDHLLEKLPQNVLEQLAQSHLLGLYIGHAAGTRDVGNFSKYSFVIAPPTIATSCRRRGYKGPILQLSGFNFLPDEYFEKVPVECLTSFALYVGNFQKRKALDEAIVIGANLLRSRKVEELRFVVSARDRFERNLRRILVSLFVGVPVVRFLQKQEGKNLSRGEVRRQIEASSIVIVPYKSEGAARVVAEAEALGKPMILNGKMEGGSLDFVTGQEDFIYWDCHKIFIDFFWSCLKEKDRSKKIVYSAKYSTARLEGFIRKHFGIEIDVRHGHLVNAFSAHRNELPSMYTSSHDDQIRSVNQLMEFLFYYGFVDTFSMPDFKGRAGVFRFFRRWLDVARQSIGRAFYFFRVLTVASKLRLTLCILRFHSASEKD